MDTNRLKEVADLAAEARNFQLENVEILNNFNLTQLAEVYNGIGSDSFPSWLRKFLDWLHPSLEKVALIHDCEWHLSDRTKKSFKESNDRFKRNGIKVADATYGWYNPLRYVVRADAVKFAWACQKFGWDAWVS